MIFGILKNINTKLATDVVISFRGSNVKDIKWNPSLMCVNIENITFLNI